MDLTWVVMWVGFALASYSVVGNDVIQTLGTFLTSNEQKMKWYVLFAFAGTILSLTLIYGYFFYDLSYERLAKFDIPTSYPWYYMLPPIVLLIITRYGIPVSTTFMILTLFSLHQIPADAGSMISSLFNKSELLGGMVQKSVMGYIIAFFSAIVIYLAISRFTEKYFSEHKITPSGDRIWTVLQWCSTGFLWYQWLTQDLANIFIYLRNGHDLPVWQFFLALAILLGLLAYIFYQRGGKVQNIVRAKASTGDIRSATFVDFFYAIILLIFKDDYFGLWGGKLPMSTTWVFIGLLAGREIAIRMVLNKVVSRNTIRMIIADLLKVFFGLVVSVVLVFVIKILAHV
ncbi:MAG: hypothetical protein R2806_08165 [Saprospiraceae bacterium]